MMVIYVCEYRVGHAPSYNWQFGVLFSTEELAKTHFAEMNRQPGIEWVQGSDLVGYPVYWYAEYKTTNPLMGDYVGALRILPTTVDLYAVEAE
jgi:hypothetical protein